MIIYTRFNCRHYNIERMDQPPALSQKGANRASRRMQRNRLNAVWLKARSDLFNAFTAPSILSQTNQQFRWIGIAHPDSPQWFLNAISNKRMELKLSEWDVDVAVRGEVSVNLDSDDAVHREYVARAHKINFQGETIFSRGMRYRILTNCWVGGHSQNAHFNVVRHPELTVLDFSHGMAKLIPKNVVDPKIPMWLEVIHEQNISNRINTASADKNLGSSHASKYFDLDYEKVKAMHIDLNYGREGAQNGNY